MNLNHPLCSISSTSFKITIERVCKDVADLKIAESVEIRNQKPCLNTQPHPGPFSIPLHTLLHKQVSMLGHALPLLAYLSFCPYIFAHLKIIAGTIRLVLCLLCCIYVCALYV